MPTNSKHRGLLYCAVGREYLKQAEFSIRSALKQNPGIVGSVYTDQDSFTYHWDTIITTSQTSQTKKANSMIYKLDALLNTPYLQTIYLDSDTYIIDSVTDIFILLDKFDLVFCHGHDRNMRYSWIQQAKNDTGQKLFSGRIPYGFAPIQGGLIAYNSKKVKDFFGKVRESFIRKNYFDDQAIFRELLWESNLRFYILPPEYNFNSTDFLKHIKRVHYRIAIPKIFHYTQNKRDDIKNLVEGIYKRSDINNWDLIHKESFMKRLIIKAIKKIKAIASP